MSLLLDMMQCKFYVYTQFCNVTQVVFEAIPFITYNVLGGRWFVCGLNGNIQESGVTICERLMPDYGVKNLNTRQTTMHRLAGVSLQRCGSNFVRRPN